MDPFLEEQEWSDFDLTFNTVVREVLAPELRPDYLVRAERRVYLEHVGPEPCTFRVGDFAVIARDTSPAGGRMSAGEPAAAAACTLPIPE